MSRGRGSRPRRGASGPNVLVSGDPGSKTGVSRDPQGGGAGTTESGDLGAREFGVPQADIPGGVRHLVNPETHPSPTMKKPPRPADYHKEHGVEPDDWDHYVLPPGESEHRPAERPVPEPKWLDAVPVYQVETPQGSRVRREAACFNLNVPAAGSDPARVCTRDADRVEIRVLNEDSTVDIRIAATRADLAFDATQGTGAGSGALIWHGTNSYTEIKTQGELYAVTTSASPARLSVIIITEIAAA